MLCCHGMYVCVYIYISVMELEIVGMGDYVEDSTFQLSSTDSEFSIAHALVFQKYHHTHVYKANTKFGRILQHFFLYKYLYEVQEKYWILGSNKGNILSTWDKSHCRLPRLLFLALWQFCA